MRRPRRSLARWLQHDGVLAPGWTVEEAADLLWALMSVRLGQELVIERDWTPDRYQQRLRQLLRATLMSPKPQRTAAPGHNLAQETSAAS